MSYGEIIRKARKKEKLSQLELAEKICVSRSAIYAWEAEKFPPTDVKNITALEKILNFDPGELYALITENPPSPSPHRENLTGRSGKRAAEQVA